MILAYIVAESLQFLNELLFLIRRHPSKDSTTSSQFWYQFWIMLFYQSPCLSRKSKLIVVLLHTVSSFSRFLNAENVNKNRI